MDAKRAAAERAVAAIKDGMVVGLGTGSTAYWAIRKIAEKVEQGLQTKAVATSVQTERLARELQIPLADFSRLQAIDVAIDGADEVDKTGNLIKGGGGALLREKIVALNSKKFLVIVDESKLVDTLGKFPLPVEIVPFAAALTLQQLRKLGLDPVIRKAEKENFITDNGNLIADCHRYPIDDPAGLNTQLHAIAGVVETGLFVHTMVSTVIVGFQDGSTKEWAINSYNHPL